jgi:hypothetical protein
MMKVRIAGVGIFAIGAIAVFPAFSPAGANGQGPDPEPDGISGATSHKPLDMPPADPAPAALQPEEGSPLDRLMDAYPGVITGAEYAGGVTTVVMSDGTKLLLDDGVADKSFEARLAKPDLEDMFDCPYPAGEMAAVPAKDMDPGRVRVFDFFAAVYGGAPRAVKANLVTVKWLPSKGGRPVRFNGKNGAAEALARVSGELEALPEALMRYVVRRGGTYNWRRIAGTARPSAHGFGIAIDINARRSDYWRWAKRVGGLLVYKNRVPLEVVTAFERNGFIWGGRWYHFDTMHFEYRPELL